MDDIDLDGELPLNPDHADRLVQVAQASERVANAKKAQADAETSAALAKKSLNESDRESRKWYDRINWTVLSSIIVAGLTLGGNSLIESIRSQNSISQEITRAREQRLSEEAGAEKKLETDLVLLAMQQETEDDRVKTLKFLIDTGLIQDKEGNIKAKAEEDGGVPKLSPQAWVQVEQTARVICGEENSPDASRCWAAVTTGLYDKLATEDKPFLPPDSR